MPRPSLAVLASVALNVALIAGVAWLVLRKPGETAAPVVGTSAAAGDIQALGRVQPKGGVVTLLGPPGERIKSVPVTLGADVPAGAPLVLFTGEAERELGIRTLEAQLAEADAARAAAEKSKAARVKELDAELVQAKAKLDAELAAVAAEARVAAIQQARAGGELARLERVRAEGVAVSAQEYEQARALADQAKAKLDAAATQQAKADQQRASAEQAAQAKRVALEAEAERALAQLPGESLRAALAAARQKLADARLLAPVAGKVVKLAAHPGDTVTTAPLVQLADVGAMTVLAEVYETDVPRLRDWLSRKPSVEVQIDARVLEGDARPLKGTTTLAQVSPMIARNAVFALGPREDVDRRVVEVEVTLDAPSVQLLASYLGLQVRARFVAPQ